MQNNKIYYLICEFSLCVVIFKFGIFFIVCKNREWRRGYCMGECHFTDVKLHSSISYTSSILYLQRLNHTSYK